MTRSEPATRTGREHADRAAWHLAAVKACIEAGAVRVTVTHGGMQCLGVDE